MKKVTSKINDGFVSKGHEYEVLDETKKHYVLYENDFYQQYKINKKHFKK